MGFIVIECEYVNCINLANRRENLSAVLNRIMNHLITQNVEN